MNRVPFGGLIALSLGIACSPSPREVLIDPVLRSSCGLDPAQWSTSCLTALEVFMVATDGTVLASQCTDVSNDYATILDLVSDPDIFPVLQDVRGIDGVSVQVRGYSVLDRGACDSPTSSELLFWGSSETVDLSMSSLQVVRVALECRPECDCQALNTMPSECPQAFVPGVCTPSPNVLCRQFCDVRDDCFGGVLDCIDNACGDSNPGQMCFECISSSQCDSGYCIENTRTGESFCALRCPPLTDASVCPSWMSCNRVENGTFSLRP